MNPKNRKITYIAAPFAALALIAGVSGCAGRAEGPTKSNVAWTDHGNLMYESTVKLNDGREVTCVVYANYRQSGLSCDWEGVSER